MDDPLSEPSHSLELCLPIDNCSWINLIGRQCLQWRWCCCQTILAVINHKPTWCHNQSFQSSWIPAEKWLVWLYKLACNWIGHHGSHCAVDIRFAKMSSATVPLTTQLLTISVLSLQRQIQHNNLANRAQWSNNYDFVVVGAGGAGAIVASRLSENSNTRVLLLEAGGPDTAITDMPGNYYQFVGNPEFDWNLPIVNQPRLGRAFTMPATMSIGKVLGGSTVISMILEQSSIDHYFENIFRWNGLQSRQSA